jgi:hypothetical protein
MKLLFSLCVCLLLTACLMAGERIEAARQQNAIQDDEKCQASGAKPGEAAYDQCRAKLAAARMRSDAGLTQSWRRRRRTACAAASSTIIASDFAQGVVTTT